MLILKAGVFTCLWEWAFFSLFKNYELSFVVDELNNNSKLRKLCNIDHVPTVSSAMNS